MQIDYFYFPLSSYGYLAGPKLVQIAQKHDAKITYIPFGLPQVFAATGGALPKDRHPSRMAYRAQDLVRAAAIAEMPLNLHPIHWPTNAVPAMCALIAAQKDGSGDVHGLAQGFLHACWAEDRNIAEDDVICDLLDAHGFSRGLAMSGLLSGAEQIERNTALALERGVFGAPFFIVGDEKFWGNDRLDHLDRHLSLSVSG